MVTFYQRVIWPVLVIAATVLLIVIAPEGAGPVFSVGLVVLSLLILGGIVADGRRAQIARRIMGGAILLVGLAMVMWALLSSRDLSLIAPFVCATSTSVSFLGSRKAEPRSRQDGSTRQQEYQLSE